MSGLLTPGVADPPVLRPYQVEQADRIMQDFNKGKRAPILVSPTGSGKTVTLGHIIRDFVDAGDPVLALAPRRELVRQFSNSLACAGVDHSIYMAGIDHDNPFAPVTVASFDTVRVRLLGKDKQPFPVPRLIVIDECHLSITKRRLATLDLWSDALRLGATATPTRGDGRALGIGFDQLVDVIGVAELTRQGFLAPSRYFAPTQPDLNRVGIVAGDYNTQQLEKVMNVPLLVADVVHTWLD